MRRIASTLCCMLCCVAASISTIGCKHHLKPRWNESVSVPLAPELKSVGAIEVEAVPQDFFRGFSLATVPSLDPDFKTEVRDVIRTAIRRSGGATDVPHAPNLRITFEECSMDWRVTGVITSVVRVNMRGTLVDEAGESSIFRGMSEDTYTAFSVDVSVNSDRQFNKALQQAISNLLSDRSASAAGSPYAAEIRIFRRTMKDLGESLGEPGYGVGLSLQSGVIAFPSPNAATAGLRPGDKVVEFGGNTVGAVLTREQARAIEAESAKKSQPLVIVVDRDGKRETISCPLSSDRWRATWQAAIEREDWREALRVLDVATQGTSTSVTTLAALQLRRDLVLLLDLRDDGKTGFDTLYCSVAFIQELFDRAPFDPEMVRLSRAFVLQTIDLSRALGSQSMADDLKRRLEQFDQSQTAADSARPPSTVRPTDNALVSSGTAFVVSSDGALMTALHVVENATKIEAINSEGNVYAAQIIGELPDLDIALLGIDLKTTAYLKVPTRLTVISGDPVFTIGFPVSELLGTEPKFSDGAISSLSGMRGDLTRMQTTVPIQPGSSGGPLVNESGDVIGVIVSSAAAKAFYQETGVLPQNVNFAVRTDLARGLLRDRTFADLPPCATREEAIERARKSVFRIHAR